MPTLPIQFGSPTPVIFTDVSGNSGTSANLPVVDAATGAVNATAPVYAEQIGWLDGTGKLQAVSATNPLPVTGGGGGGGGTSSNFNSAFPTPGTAAGASDGTNMKPLLVDASGFLKVNVAAGGASGGTSSTFGSSFPGTGTAVGVSDGTNMVALKLGQALAAASVPVILPTATITTLTPPTTVTVTQGTGTNLHAVIDSGTVTANAGTNLNTSLLALESGGNLAAIKADTDKIPSLGQALAAASVPVVLTTAQISTLTPLSSVTVTQATGTNLHAVIDTGSTTAVTQATAASLNATVVGTGTFAVQAAATLAAETTKVIGVVRTADGSGNLLTSTSNALDINIKSGSIANTTFAATQATGTNLHTVVDSGTITTVSAVTAITNALPAGTNLLGQVSASGETGTLYNGTTALVPAFATISLSATGALVALVSSKRIRVLALALMANGTVNVKFQSHVTPTDISGLFYLIANTGFVLPYNPLGWFQTVSGEALDLNLSASIAVGGCLTYVAV